MMQLVDELYAIRDQIVIAAQKVYDDWTQDEEGLDEQFGGGGICDEVQRAIADVISSNIDCELEDGGWEGDDHANLIVSRDNEQYLVDIPAQIYESGGGMSWQKLSDVVITTNDIIIAAI
jgi:hypothetical protein